MLSAIALASVPQRNSQPPTTITPVVRIIIPTQPIAYSSNQKGSNATDFDPQQVIHAQKLHIRKQRDNLRKQELLLQQRRQ